MPLGNQRSERAGWNERVRWLFPSFRLPNIKTWKHRPTRRGRGHESRRVRNLKTELRVEISNWSPVVQKYGNATIMVNSFEVQTWLKKLGLNANISRIIPRIQQFRFYLFSWFKETFIVICSIICELYVCFRAANGGITNMFCWLRLSINVFSFAICIYLSHLHTLFSVKRKIIIQ